MFLDLIRQRRRLRDQLEIVDLQMPGEEAVFSDGQLTPILELGKPGFADWSKFKNPFFDEESIDYRHHRPGRILSGRLTPEEGV